MLAAEAGLIDVPKGALAVPFSARLFFSFRAASENAEDAPVLVFVNGSATSDLFMEYGTGPMTLDVVDAPRAVPRENPNSYTRFANLLYLDTREYGFSYVTGGDTTLEHGDSKPGVVWASDLVLATLEFLDARPALRDNPVVFMGESYGGVYASLALSLVDSGIDPGRPPILPDLSAEVPWLADRLAAHADAAFPRCAGAAPRSAAIRSQFGAEVLVQPGLRGLIIDGPDSPAQTLAENDPLLKAFVVNPAAQESAYDIRDSSYVELAEDAQRTAGIWDPDTLALMLGMPVEAVPRLGANNGRGVARRTSSIAAEQGQEASLTRLLGSLGPGDAYYLDVADTSGDFEPTEQLARAAFERNLADHHLFVTNARFDAVVYTKALPAILEADGFHAPTPDVWDRDTVLHVESPTGKTSDIRLPAYESGHTVTQTAAKEFGDDLEAWLGGLGYLPAARARRGSE